MARCLSSLIRTQGIGDIATIYFLTQRDGVEFNLAFIPENFHAQPKESFDKAYMKQLFKLGYDEAISGYQWTTPSKPVE
jgi:hypothetical protein